MTIAPPSPLGRALTAAIAELRRSLAAPMAPIAVITPSDANGVLARQQLALAGDYVRVEFLTPERLVRDLGRRSLAARGLRAQPSAWLDATVGSLLHDDRLAGALGPYVDVLAQPGWNVAVARAIETLEAAGVDPRALTTVPAPEHAERLRLLAALMDGVAERRRIDLLYSMSDLCEAAMASLRDERWAGAVLLGDRLLAPRVHGVVRAWLRLRPHVEVRPHPWHRLEATPMGLRAAGSGRVHDVPAEGTARLAAVARGLFGPTAQAAPTDDTVVLARTPDEVRELGEAAAVVLDAIQAGTALDQIAIVLPDAEQVSVLRSHLERAGVPATWLTGPPISTTPAASFLLHALDVAAGDDTVPAWYDLLRQPGLRLRAAIAADVTEGRGRWRRILSKCGAVRDTPTIVRAVEAWDLEGDLRSSANLLRAIRALSALFEGLRQPATLGEHARRWSKLLHTWWVPSPDREQVRGALAGWGAPGVGAVLSLEAASTELRNTLARAPALEGSLSDPAVRVLTPMTLLGGAFELVVVTGLTEGRMPRRPDEDPLLPDALLEAINAALGTSLLGSRDLAGFETRRFASIVGSCTRKLWLSAPASELLKERPLLPSTLLLDTASVILGRRARFRDLARMQVRFGSRARPWPERPERAVGTLEHRIATTAIDPRAGLRRLALHATARRLLGLHRALDLAAPSTFTGQVDPTILPVPGMDGTPVPVWTLRQLLADPAAYFVSQVLAVRRSPILQAASDPTRRWWLDQQLQDAVATALDGTGDLRAGVEAAWDEAIAAWREYRVDVSDETLALIRALTMQRLDRLLDALPTGTRDPVSGQPVPQLPWVVEGEVGWVDQEVLGSVEREKPARGKLGRDVPELVLVGMVSPGVTELRVAALDGRVEAGDLATAAAEVRERLVKATECASRGWWPAQETGDVHLAADPTFDYTEELP